MRKIDEVFVIYIEKIEDGVSKGSFINPYIKEYVEFSDLNDMILKINRIIQEKAGQYQGTNQKCYHTFHELAFARCSSSFRYFYFLEVLYTEYSSWQGQVTGTDCPRTCFKSVLDLLEKINQSMVHERNRKIIKMKGRADGNCM